MLVQESLTAAESGGSPPVQEWVLKLGAEGDPREAAAMAMVKMIETRDLVDSHQKGSTSKEKLVSQSDMSAFIEDLVPGKSCGPPVDADLVLFLLLLLCECPATSFSGLLALKQQLVCHTCQAVRPGADFAVIQLCHYRTLQQGRWGISSPSTCDAPPCPCSCLCSPLLPCLVVSPGQSQARWIAPVKAWNVRRRP